MQFTRKHVATNTPFPRLTRRSLKWMGFINRHGPLPSGLLFELTRNTHRCKDTAVRQLQRLCEQGVLFRPSQQKSALNAPFNPFIYDLTNRGLLALNEDGIGRNLVRPTGHFPHQLLTSCVTASIEHSANRAGAKYIEAQDILALRDAPLGLPIGSQTLIPDQLFAIKNSKGYRMFALEVDRGTEPATSAKLRKSYQSAIRAYEEVLTRGVHRRHYGVKSNLVVLWVFTSIGRQRLFKQHLESISGALNNVCFTTTVQGFHHGWRPPKTALNLKRSRWENSRQVNLELQ